ncbi:hypothetical protein SASPL_123997 [Salvia splendens]|uniref:Uncharacterized protein n=1 Tax=Salvia splendens TaxID=180675 RepID=A0A8X8XLE6_SALSN|nr:hypothetical protein SASPL_123997 [Salvia splendens]
MVSKNLRDIQGSALLAIIGERLKPYGAFQDNYESGRSVSSSMASKTAQRWESPMVMVTAHLDMEAEMHLQYSCTYQGIQASFYRVSSRHKHSVTSPDLSEGFKQGTHLFFGSNKLQLVWERIIVRRFKFEELRIEQIQDLEIIGQLKSLQIVASLTAERDGDDIWRYVGKLTEAQRSICCTTCTLVNRQALEMEKRKEGRPGEARAALRRSVRDNAYEFLTQLHCVFSAKEACSLNIFQPEVSFPSKIYVSGWNFKPSNLVTEKVDEQLIRVHIANICACSRVYMEEVIRVLVLQNTIYDVDLDRILQSIHVYLQELGMDEIRKRAGADDKPLRMVKTVLHELVKLRGTAIKGHLSMVPIDMQPQPIILAYIDLNLQTLAAARMLTPSGPVGQTHWSDSNANNTAPAAHSADAQLKQELAAIFKKIGEKQTCSIGLYELYRITQLYPQVDIFAQLHNAGEAFRTYIRDGLAQMEKNAAAGRTPSSVPLSTPPPAALYLSSRYGSLSPVNADPLNDSRNLNAGSEPTNFSLPPSFAEDDHRLVNAVSQKVSYDPSGLPQNFEESRNDRLPSGVSNGTLDAIRERMKSIQLAAGGVNPESRSRPLIQVNGNGDEAHGSMQGGILAMDEKALSGLQARMERLKSGSFDSM